MHLLSKKLVMLDAGDKPSEPAHFCPGCRHLHVINIHERNSSNAIWTWNGNAEKPTFHPSINCGPGICHYFLVDGNINFCSDSVHALAGKTVPLPEIPEEEYEWLSQ